MQKKKGGSRRGGKMRPFDRLAMNGQGYGSGGRTGYPAAPKAKKGNRGSPGRTGSGGKGGG